MEMGRRDRIDRHPRNIVWPAQVAEGAAADEARPTRRSTDWDNDTSGGGSGGSGATPRTARAKPAGWADNPLYEGQADAPGAHTAAAGDSPARRQKPKGWATNPLYVVGGPPLTPTSPTGAGVGRVLHITGAAPAGHRYAAIPCVANANDGGGVVCAALAHAHTHAHARAHQHHHDNGHHPIALPPLSPWA